ncbi:MAG TPA: hypothetical protein VFF69_05265 [Phycisphaerales bacterium]|nr:hypothetical protein [Phycisphaerales bacterium]
MDFSYLAAQRTRIWLSDQADKALRKLKRKGNIAFFTKLDDCVERGFANFIGTAIRPEPYRTWRFGVRDCKTRMAGFFENDGTMAEFIVPTAFTKEGNANTPAQNDIYKDIGDIRDKKTYRKVTP